MKFELEGKKAVITGGSRGIGRACAEVLAEEGCDVLLAARDPAKLTEAADAIRRKHQRRVETCAADLSTLAGVDAMAKTARDFGDGRIDILVNNAGATKRGDFLKLTDDDFVAGFALKFFGYVRATRALWPMLMAAKGTIVNVIGAGGRNASADFTIGGSVNAALFNFTKAMADRGLHDGVRVNALNPGLIRTERWENFLKAQSLETGKPVEALRAEALALLTKTSRGVGEAVDVARAVAFLASSASRHIHGALIDIDGGGGKAI